MNDLTIVMYHYVRELEHCRYPAIKGLAVDHFRQQVAYLKKHYHPISGHDLMAAVESGNELPPRSVLLTFDDGYLDHFTEVFPVLDREKISGCFFPPAKCILENTVLDVNKIHFILASVADKASLVEHVLKAVDEYRSSFELESRDFYWQKLAVAGRYDPADVMFVKSMLQRELPEKLRNLVVAELFSRFVSADEKAFSKELYMGVDQLSCLNNNGMYVGSHGHDHYWLDSLPEDGQRREIELSLEFLKLVGSDPKRWIMCFPYGAYNETTLSILQQKNCSVGLATKVGLANLGRDNRLALPRLNTNDLPKDADAAPNEWTRAVMAGD